MFLEDITENDLDGSEDWMSALSTPNVIVGSGGEVIWRDCHASIMLVGSDGKYGKVVKIMEKKKGRCVLLRGYALYGVGIGGQLKQV